MKLEEAYKKFIEKHTKGRKGERLRRLQAGQGHTMRLFLENVWWPALGNFEDLHPEFEINDFKDGLRFIDFAFFIFAFRIAIEIDDYGTHIQKASRWQHSDQCLRQNHLTIDGWKIIRFTHDDIKERPRMCMQIIQQLIGKLSGTQIIQHDQISIEEKEILSFCLRLNRSITPSDVCLLLSIENQTARKILHRLVEKSLLIPGGEGTKRIKCFRPSTNIAPSSIGL
ncbi:DNA-binding response regulator [Paenibacillus psychroresistens]|uniref:DNA-binding response regulator n=1 Tax=Paenibacillus psychroresistens TaxID=1778678 RepID=A0A6B8RR51_9BACL|nr:DNA-binding response regulator [Paenibacillus psychroresistens]QGQ97963.1 DNA-binding response regulator [Paenibacillus psychroresistens]